MVLNSLCVSVPCVGLVCPHADKVQSNGLLRIIDFDAMLLRHPGERGICIDHFAALIVDGEEYSILSLPGRPGSVLDNGKCSFSREGVPGMWIKDVEEASDGTRIISTRLVPTSGMVTDILRPAQVIVQDPRLDSCRQANPIN
jgi:dipeptidase E